MSTTIRLLVLAAAMVFMAAFSPKLSAVNTCDCSNTCSYCTNWETPATGSSTYTTALYDGTNYCVFKFDFLIKTCYCGFDTIRYMKINQIYICGGNGCSNFTADQYMHQAIKELLMGFYAWFNIYPLHSIPYFLRVISPACMWYNDTTKTYKTCDDTICCSTKYAVNPHHYESPYDTTLYVGLSQPDTTYNQQCGSITGHQCTNICSANYFEVGSLTPGTNQSCSTYCQAEWKHPPYPYCKRAKFINRKSDTLVLMDVYYNYKDCGNNTNYEVDIYKLDIVKNNAGWAYGDFIEQAIRRVLNDMIKKYYTGTNIDITVYLHSCWSDYMNNGQGQYWDGLLIPCLDKQCCSNTYTGLHVNAQGDSMYTDYDHPHDYGLTCSTPPNSCSIYACFYLQDNNLFLHHNPPQQVDGIINDCKVAAYQDSSKTNNQQETIIDEISIKPNPANEKLTLNIKSSANGDLEVKIYDLKGNVVLSSLFYKNGKEFEKVFDISKFQNGGYYVMIKIGDNHELKTYFVISR